MKKYVKPIVEVIDLEFENSMLYTSRTGIDVDADANVDDSDR